MQVSSARRPLDLGLSRRERRERERTRSQLDKLSVLEAEARAEGARRLGPAGRPVGDAALASWVRDQTSAYLALSPWRRAWLTWRAWGPARRGLLVLAAACLWTVIVLPLRMIGLATLEVSQIGVAVLAVLAPVLAFVPPGSRGRFARELPRPGPPWRSSRRAGRIRRWIALGAIGLVGAFVGAVLFGPGLQGPDAGLDTASGERASRIVVERVLDRACPGVGVTEVTRLEEAVYAAVLADGSRARVRIEFTGRAPTGTGSGHGVLLEPRPACA